MASECDTPESSLVYTSWSNFFCSPSCIIVTCSLQETHKSSRLQSNFVGQKCATYVARRSNHTNYTAGYPPKFPCINRWNPEILKDLLGMIWHSNTVGMVWRIPYTLHLRLQQRSAMHTTILFPFQDWFGTEKQCPEFMAMKQENLLYQNRVKDVSKKLFKHKEIR